MSIARTPIIFLFSLLASSASAFTSTLKEQTNTYPLSPTRQTLEEQQWLVLRAHQSDTSVQNHTSFDDDTEGMIIPRPKFSKSRWKKKRYLMIRDVRRLIQQNDAHAVRKAEEVVRRMLTMYEKSGGDRDYRPTLHAYNMWIHALAKSDRPNAGKLTEDIVEQMIRNDVRPNVVTYTSVLDAYARSSSTSKVEEVMFRLIDEAQSSSIEFSSVTCDAILNAWAKQGTRESAERAHMILHRLGEMQHGNMRPTEYSYATVMNAWAKVGTTEAAEQAEDLLDSMLRSSGDNVIKPDVTVFNSAINAWATSKDPIAGKKAFALLRKMRDLDSRGYDTYPDIVTYNTVLSAWSHCGDVNAAPQTEKIVNEMQKAAKESPTAPRPNTVSYNTILDAWSKSTLPGSALRAQKVLQFMITSEEDEIEPDVISFTSVLDAWAKSKEPHKGARTRDLLNRLVTLYETTKRQNLRPTQISYNSVLNACAFSAIGTSLEEQREALQIAVSTFSEMRKKSPSTAPDTVSYGNMLKCLANLMPQGDLRTKMAMQIFAKCCEEGLVGTFVWNEIRRAVPSWELEEKLNLRGSVGSMQLKHLPRAWRIENTGDRLARPIIRRKKDTTPFTPRVRQTIVETSFQSGKDL